MTRTIDSTNDPVRILRFVRYRVLAFLHYPWALGDWRRCIAWVLGVEKRHTFLFMPSNAVS